MSNFRLSTSPGNLHQKKKKSVSQCYFHHGTGISKRRFALRCLPSAVTSKPQLPRGEMFASALHRADYSLSSCLEMLVEVISLRPQNKTVIFSSRVPQGRKLF